jgi:hypothetical protein
MLLKRASAGVTLFCVSLTLIFETISVRAQERISPDNSGNIKNPMVYHRES